MPLTNIDHYAIRTNKLEETKAFYVMLGLVEGGRPNFPFAGYWLYLDNVSLIHLIHLDYNQSPVEDGHLGNLKKIKKDIHGRGSIDHIAFRATNAEQLKTKLERNNIPFQQREVPNMNLSQIFLEDPNGITVEINYYQ